VRILYSRASSIMSPHQHLRAINASYRDVAFLGAPIGFITERQLAGREFEGVKVILVPAVDHIPDAALDGLREFTENAGGTVALTVGPSAFKTERGEARDAALRVGGTVVALADAKNARRTADDYARLFDRAGVTRTPGARPNLEVRQATMPDDSIVRAYLNYGNRAEMIALSADGGEDLISRQFTRQLSVPPLGVALIRLRATGE